MNMRHEVKTRQAGFNLMEVLIAVLIFAIGMLALAHLQGNLTRSSADSTVRTVASNIAEEQFELQRGFGLLDTDPDGLIAAYGDITGSDSTLSRGGIVYTVDQDVQDYYYDPATDSFGTANNTFAAHSDFKLVTINVAWDDQREFRLSETQETVDLGTGSITLNGVISSATTQSDSKVLTQSSGHDDPIISYTPGANPDILSLSLGENKFKESTTPQPDVIRLDELVESRFDVITYSQTGDGALFLRREEFASVSCECTLRAPPGSAEAGSRRPTIWAGDEYAEGHRVDKPFGVSANQLQSPLCVTCCQDHHDGGTSEDDHADSAVNRYDPFRPASDYYDSGSFEGDHKHYIRSRTGLLSLATSDGDTYVEACRMVRKDGFFKVAQDFRQEDRHLFPADFLDETSEVDTYSAYVTGAAGAYHAATSDGYESNPPCIGGPSPCVAEPPMAAAWPAPRNAGEFPAWTTLPLNGSSTQQLRSRGIYIDYLSDDLRSVIACLDAGGDKTSCTSGDVVLDRTGSVNVLELLPFFDVQLTWLYRWTETPTNAPVDTTNEPLEDLNAHSRGIASRSVLGGSEVESTGHPSNIGFTDTAPINPDFESELQIATIVVQSVDSSGGGGTNPGGDDPNVPKIFGFITETVNGLRATDITVEGLNGALCDRTPGGFECVIPDGLSNPRVRVAGYQSPSLSRWVCMTGPNQLTKNSETLSGSTAHATFNLYDTPQPDGDGYDFNVQPEACDVTP
jgi:prepilin-type N-terminal cleavage/methylation domain-containing protein